MNTDHRFDQTAARQFELIYSVPQIIARRQKTLAMLDLKPGEQVLDIGSGPGYFVVTPHDESHVRARNLPM